MSDKSKLPTTGQGVRRVQVTDEDAGQRIDNFVIGAFKGLPKSRVYRLLRKGEVRVNGKRVRQAQRLVAGDEVRLPPVRLEPRSEPQVPAEMAKRLLDQTIFEDKRLLVINKPAGMAVHGGSGLSFGVVECLRTARSDLADLGLVHRLDRETSGALVLAKRRSALRELNASFREGRVEKRYLAGCVGHWPHGDIVCDAPLEVRHRQQGERHVVVAASGKAAETRFSPQAFYDGFTMVAVEPLTGRTHQIRVHAARLLQPLAMDLRYGDEEANEKFKKRGLKRLFLHAQSIAFADTSGNEQLFSAPLANDLERFLRNRRRQQ